VIAPLTRVVDAWLRRDITVRASVIHERLVAEHGFTGSYQRVKIYVGDRRPRIAASTASCTTATSTLTRTAGDQVSVAAVIWSTTGARCC